MLIVGLLELSVYYHVGLMFST